MITLFQDAIDLATRRAALSANEYVAACDAIYNRFAEVLVRSSIHSDVRRIQKRLHKYMDEISKFLVEQNILADN